MRIGPTGGAPILFLPPLLEEMNRTRALMVAVMRELAAEGFCSWLPDLPGTGESEHSLEACGWDDWTTAARLVADRARSPEGKLLIASLRGGALLDDMPATAHWRFAPVDGASLIRDLDRSSLIGADGQAGYSLSEQLKAGMAESSPPSVTPCRLVRLDSDPKPADAKLNGPALWRRSEPATSAELVHLIASDIRNWARTCAIC
jgi:pimeloyl-ACP methyl ester carboxylesterase